MLLPLRHSRWGTQRASIPVRSILPSAHRTPIASTIVTRSESLYQLGRVRTVVERWSHYLEVAVTVDRVGSALVRALVAVEDQVAAGEVAAALADLEAAVAAPSAVAENPEERDLVDSEDSDRFQLFYTDHYQRGRNTDSHADSIGSAPVHIERLHVRTL